jgi:hypothetical protein
MMGDIRSLSFSSSRVRKRVDDDAMQQQHRREHQLVTMGSGEVPELLTGCNGRLCTTTERRRGKKKEKKKGGKKPTDWSIVCVESPSLVCVCVCARTGRRTRGPSSSISCGTQTKEKKNYGLVTAGWNQKKNRQVKKKNINRSIRRVVVL